VDSTTPFPSSKSSSHPRSPAAHPFRKPAIDTDRVRVFAEVPPDLHQSLLTRRRLQSPVFSGPQQTLPGEFQDGVVLRRRPREKPPFHFVPNFFIAALACANPQPRQNRVHRQVSDARRAQQWLRFCQPRGFERPMLRPEFILPDLKSFMERLQQLFIRQFRGTPAFNV